MRRLFRQETRKTRPLHDRKRTVMTTFRGNPGQRNRPKAGKRGERDRGKGASKSGERWSAFRTPRNRPRSVRHEIVRVPCAMKPSAFRAP
jgi:hypothetical protein